ncbi:MAG: hypothetical protein BYD32DRAFT_438312 [Podila humilis]|nr:MAG: hypothetical protein BYD32DRAFT_438312 [Podila humilis]
MGLETCMGVDPYFSITRLNFQDINSKTCTASVSNLEVSNFEVSHLEVSHLEKRDLLSICGSAIVKYAPDVATYLWNHALQYTRETALTCMKTLFWAHEMCVTKPARQNQVRVGDNRKIGCSCAYDAGTAVNIENFLTFDKNNLLREIQRRIESDLWHGATHMESGCGDTQTYMHIGVSCTGNNVLDSVKACSVGTTLPPANLRFCSYNRFGFEAKSKPIRKVSYRINCPYENEALDTNPKPPKPAPCETRPPYCNRGAAPTPA